MDSLCRIGWLSDIHLDFCTPVARLSFFRTLKDARLDALLVSGDIGTSPTLAKYLQPIAESVDGPLYFVLGNHDFYYGSRNKTRAWAAESSNLNRHWRYLHYADPVLLAADTYLCGVDGWGDAREGNVDTTPIKMNDWVMIEEMGGLALAVEQRNQILRTWGDEDAARLREQLGVIPAQAKRVWCLTHVPPFKEASWHRGQVGEPDFLPFYVCRAVGDVLLEFCKERPDCQVMVLCGHTHSTCPPYKPLENLTVWAAEAEYRNPALQEVFDLSRPSLRA